jgi:hypothetical protein
MKLGGALQGLFGVGLCLIAGCAAPMDPAAEEKTPPPDPYYGAEGDDLSKADTAKRPATSEPIAFGVVKTTELTPKAEFRGFTFSGSAGQLVDMYADGLDGLDTVLYLYRLSPHNGRPLGWPLVSNDDTPQPGWILQSNTEPNVWSSSVNDFALPEDGGYALVVTSFWQLYDGLVEVVVKTPGAGKMCGGFANAGCPDGQICMYQLYTCTIPDMAGMVQV